jgi:zinc protease
VAGIGVPRATPDYHAIEVMNTALGGLFSSRINMNLREAHGYTYGAYSQFVFRRSAGPFFLGGSVRTDVTAPAVVEILKEARAMIERPLSTEELQLSKDALARSVPANFETSGNAASSFANVYVYDLGLDYYARYAERTDAVTADDALAAARTHLRPDELIVVAVGDRARIEPALRQLGLGAVEIWDR